MDGLVKLLSRFAFVLVWIAVVVVIGYLVAMNVAPALLAQGALAILWPHLLWSLVALAFLALYIIGAANYVRNGVLYSNLARLLIATLGAAAVIFVAYYWIWQPAYLAMQPYLH